ncbi:hypothetical protein PAMP_010306 [Pampus punctatissimus]
MSDSESKGSVPNRPQPAAPKLNKQEDQIPFGHPTEVNCLYCGGCGHLLDVWWASGQPVAHRDSLLQTSLSCQLTPFPRVPQSKRPSESISANTQGVLDQLLMELHRFMLMLDKENLSGNATIQKGLLSDLLQSYRSSNGADEEYIYMNKVTLTGKDKGNKDDRSDTLVALNGKAAKYSPVPQKSLPDLPPPRTVSDYKPNCPIMD